MNIKGGYVLQPRAIDMSEAAKYPPHVREIWQYLIRKACYKPTVVGGRTLERGQLYATYADIIESLSWYVGFCKVSYTVDQCSYSLKALRKANMIASRRTSRGLIITICNYESYQDSKNYESQSESQSDNQMECPPIYKEEKKQESKKKNRVAEKSQRFVPPTLPQVDEFCEQEKIEIDTVRFHNFYQSKGWKVGCNPMKDWRAAARTWQRRDQDTQKGGIKHATTNQRKKSKASQDPRFGT